MYQGFLSFDERTWRKVLDGNDAARSIFRRHYSYRPYRDGRNPKLFVGPGEKLVIITAGYDALFVWRKFISGDGQQGVNCAVFRNESSRLSSVLIGEACALAWEKWRGARLYTYVNPKKLHISKRRGREYCHWPPGNCFIQAGWSRCGVTKHNKLVILERWPDGDRDSREG
jgi:hypothetical protein